MLCINMQLIRYAINTKQFAWIPIKKDKINLFNP